MIVVISQLILVIIILCLTVVYLYLRTNYGYWKRCGIPYEEPTMLFGTLGGLMRISSFDLMYDLSKKHKNKDYLGIFLGWKPTLLINTKELAKKVLVVDFDSFQNRHTFGGGPSDPLGAFNLFTVKNPLWSMMKQALAPMFTSLRLKGVTELMNINSAELVRRIQTDYINNKKPVDLKELFSMYTSDTVGYSVFGLRVSALKDLTSPLWLVTQHMAHWTFWRGLEFSIILFTPAIARIMRMKFFSKPATDYVKRMFKEVVEQRKKVEGAHANKDLVNHLLKIKDNLKLPTDADPQLAENLVLAQVAVFILGSIETSASTLSFLLHELAYHPEKQEKLYEEISKARQEKGKEVLEFSDLLEINYLTACIKETLRKYPVVAFLDRECNRKYQLTEDVTVEEGTPVYVNVIAIHYNEEYWPEPEKWNPERFGITTENDNHDTTFLPFGVGPRYCIGKRYGITQVRTAVAHMMMKYRFQPAEPYIMEKHPYSVVLCPKSGGKVKFLHR